MKYFFSFLLVVCFANAPRAQDEARPIHVEVTGHGEPLLFIPGFTVPGDIWNPLVEQLASDYECHVVTLAGFGGQAPIEFPWLPKVNDALEDYIQEFDVKGVTVIGHSLGGTIATWLASRADSRVSQIVLVDALPAAGALMIPDYDPDNLVYESPYNDQQLARDDADFEQLATNMAQMMCVDQDARQEVKDWIIEADRKTYVYGYTDYLKLDLREDLKRISVPVSIFAADQPFGREMVVKNYKDQYANLQDYDLIIAENSAHFIMLDQPEWFGEQIRAVLSSR
ncbi:MAG: alpha/beta hydrolase [Bacteroidota bacterium]